MKEVPPKLQALFLEQAARNNVSIVRDEMVELRLASDGNPDSVFSIFWPSDSTNIYMLMPKRYVYGKG